MKTILLVAVSVAAMALAGCGKKDEAPRTTTAPTAPASVPAPSAGVSVSNLTVGNAIGADKRVQSASSTLGPRDTIYVSIDTAGSGNATLKSRWTYLKDGKSTLVNEDSRSVSGNGPATHEFHISKPDGWPKGDYQVEIFVNDTPAGSRRFAVS